MQAATLQQELQRQLRLSASSPHGKHAASPAANGHGSATNSTSSASSYRTAGQSRPHTLDNNSSSNIRSFGDFNGPPSSSSVTAGGRSRTGTIVVESETVLVSSNSSSSTDRAAARSNASVDANGDGGGFACVVTGRGGGSVYDDPWSDDSDDDGEGGDRRSRRGRGRAGAAGDCGLGEILGALSSWRPFAWCQPPRRE